MSDNERKESFREPIDEPLRLDDDILIDPVNEGTFFSEQKADGEQPAPTEGSRKEEASDFNFSIDLDELLAQEVSGAKASASPSSDNDDKLFELPALEPDFSEVEALQLVGKHLQAITLLEKVPVGDRKSVWNILFAASEAQIAGSKGKLEDLKRAIDQKDLQKCRDLLLQRKSGDFELPEFKSLCEHAQGFLNQKEREELEQRRIQAERELKESQIRAEAENAKRIAEQMNREKARMTQSLNLALKDRKFEDADLIVDQLLSLSPDDPKLNAIKHRLSEVFEQRNEKIAEVVTNAKLLISRLRFADAENLISRIKESQRSEEIKELLERVLCLKRLRLEAMTELSECIKRNSPEKFHRLVSATAYAEEVGSLNIADSEFLRLKNAHLQNVAESEKAASNWWATLVIGAIIIGIVGWIVWQFVKPILVDRGIMPL